MVQRDGSVALWKVHSTQQRRLVHSRLRSEEHYVEGGAWNDAAIIVSSSASAVWRSSSVASTASAMNS